MLHRKTDNSPVTDESLARVRDEIAEAYSHASPDTITLDVTTYPAALYAAHEELNRLRSQLAEAVALLRDVAKRLDGYDGPGATRLRLVSQASTARSFLSRLDAAKGTK